MKKKIISLAEKNPALLKEWSDMNDNLSPYDVSYGSNKIVWWIGKCGHVWQASIKNRNNGSGCPFCSGNRVMYGVNDLFTAFPNVAEEWSDRNYPLMPKDVTPKANKSVWWRCSACGHEWKARVADRTDGHGCPVCAGAHVEPGINDLATKYPDIAVEWDLENICTPDAISPKSRQKVWWRCKKCGFRWEAVVYTRVLGQRCPQCLRNERLEERRIAKCDKTGIIIDRIKKGIAELGINVKYYDDSKIGVSLLFYFPDYSAAVEISGKNQNRGPLHRFENGKNWLCLNAGIKLVRILLPGAEGYKNCELLEMKNNSIEEAYRIADKAITYIITEHVDDKDNMI